MISHCGLQKKRALPDYLVLVTLHDNSVYLARQSFGFAQDRFIGGFFPMNSYILLRMA